MAEKTATEQRLSDNDDDEVEVVVMEDDEIGRSKTDAGASTRRNDDTANGNHHYVHHPQPLTLHELVALQSRRTLHFSVSDIAAMCGFHPYRNLPQLVYRLVYHGRLGATLQRMDAQALGLSLEVVTEEQVWKSLAAQAGPGTTQALNKAFRGKATQTVQEAQALKEEVVRKATASGKLKPQELKVLKEGTRHVVNTRFGNHHEDNALDQAEAKFGWEIFDRNEQILEWPFRDAGNTVEPIHNAKPRYYGRGRRARKNNEGIGDHSTEGKRQKRDSQAVLDLIGDPANKEEKMAGGEASMDKKPASKEAALGEAKEVVAEGKASLEEMMAEGPECLDKKPAAKEAVTVRAAVSPKDKPSNDTKMEIEDVKQSAETQNQPAKEQMKSAKLDLGRTAEEAKQNLASSSAAGHDHLRQAKDHDPVTTVIEQPIFILRGSVDGRRDELVPADGPSHDEFDDWVMRPVVVELKHRMNRIFNVPPLYEQIQAVAYCLMYRVSEADLVQCIRLAEKEEERDVKAEKEGSAGSNGEKEDSATTNTGKTDANTASEKNTLLNYCSPKSREIGESSVSPTKDAVAKELLPETELFKDSSCDEGEASDDRDPNVAREEGRNTTMDADPISQAPAVANQDSPSNQTIPVKESKPNAGQGIAEAMSQSVQPPSPSQGVWLEKGVEGVADKPGAVGSACASSGAQMEEGCDAKVAATNDDNRSKQAKAPSPGCIETASKKRLASSVLVEDREQEEKPEDSVPSADSNQAPVHNREGPDSKEARIGRRRKTTRLSMQADRISLHDPTLQHERNWHEVILPRLHSFASAVYSIRKDDSKRYRLLHACSDPLGELDQEAWTLLFEECGWLKDCDTAFRRCGGPQ